MAMQFLPATTPSGEVVVVQAVNLDAPDDLGGEEAQVSGGIPSLDDALRAVQDLSEGFRRVTAAVTPRKATVEFSIAFAISSGQLTAMFVEGKTEGSVKVTLEWGSSDKD
jgi:hypothetical protein